MTFNMLLDGLILGHGLFFVSYVLFSLAVFAHRRLWPASCPIDPKPAFELEHEIVVFTRPISTELPADSDELIPSWTEINAAIERHWPASQIKEERVTNIVEPPTWSDADFDLSIAGVNAFEQRFSAAASIFVPSATLTVEDMPMIERAAGDMTKAELKAELRRLCRQVPRGRANHAKLVGLVEAAWAAESNA